MISRMTDPARTATVRRTIRSASLLAGFCMSTNAQTPPSRYALSIYSAQANNGDGLFETSDADNANAVGGYAVVRVGKLYHYGVPGQIGTDGLDDKPSWQSVINPRGRDKDDEEKGLIFTLTPNAKGSARFGASLSWLAAEGADAEQTDGKIADETIKLLGANRDKPFFVACGFFRPHTPYVAPKKYFDMYPPDALELPTVPEGHRAAGPAPAFGSAKAEQDKMTDDLRRKALQAYYASTTFMDAQVGRVLEALEKQKLADRTIVVFMSDHGYHLGEHGLWQKMSLFENSARVPLVVYDTRAKGNGKACARPVEL
ncbi:MAG: sulfatase-like hydrolase/transferase, partial [Planctomycetes bacterium]|nr:sulfatase-like hydrolase/transferase [Planctomycetota bacterium]